MEIGPLYTSEGQARGNVMGGDPFSWTCSIPPTREVSWYVSLLHQHAAGRPVQRKDVAWQSKSYPEGGQASLVVGFGESRRFVSVAHAPYPVRFPGFVRHNDHLVHVAVEYMTKICHT